MASRYFNYKKTHDEVKPDRFLIQETATPKDIAVPENLKKKMETKTTMLEKKRSLIADKKAKNKVIRHNIKLSQTKRVAELKKTENNLVACRRDARRTGNYYVEPEAKLMFAIRITGINKVAPKPRKIMKLLRLDQLHKGTFIKVTKPMKNMLKYIQPYVMCGYPNEKTVRELIMKRGYAKVNKERIRIQNNQIVEENLGHLGIHGVDDLIKEIQTVGPNFKQANNFLWAFKLSSPRGGFVNKLHGFNEPRGGDWGNREEMINDIIRRMN
jgi:large subunit ribosomal protein L7e